MKYLWCSMRCTNLQTPFSFFISTLHVSTLVTKSWNYFQIVIIIELDSFELVYNKVWRHHIDMRCRYCEVLWFGDCVDLEVDFLLSNGNKYRSNITLEDLMQFNACIKHVNGNKKIAMNHEFFSALKMSASNRHPFEYYIHVCCSYIGCGLEV